MNEKTISSEECTFQFELKVTCRSPTGAIGEAELEYDNVEDVRAVFEAGLLQWMKGKAFGDVVRKLTR